MGLGMRRDVRRAVAALGLAAAMASAAPAWAQASPQPVVGQKLVDGQAYVTLVQLRHHGQCGRQWARAHRLRGDGHEGHPDL